MQQATPKVIASGWVVVNENGCARDGCRVEATEIKAWRDFLNTPHMSGLQFEVVDDLERRGYRAVRVHVTLAGEGE